jgi:hydrogenase maturation protease
MNAAPRTIVLGWGNVTRSDDALGPLLLERIRAAQFPHVTVIEDFQLQVEHALDLRGHDLALFADAGFETPAPFAFYQITPQPDTAFSSHKMAPEAVLDVYARVIGETPPPAFVLSIAGEDFAVGDGLSPAAAQRLELASNFLLRLLRAPSLENWQVAANAVAGHR